MFESSTWQDRLSRSTLKIPTATIFNTVRMGSVQERSKSLSTIMDCTAMTSWSREMPTAKVLWCVLATSIMAARQVKTSPRKTSIMTTYRNSFPKGAHTDFIHPRPGSQSCTWHLRLLPSSYQPDSPTPTGSREDTIKQQVCFEYLR